MKSKYTMPKLNKTSKYWYIYYRYDGVQFIDLSVEIFLSTHAKLHLLPFKSHFF